MPAALQTARNLYQGLLFGPYPTTDLQPLSSFKLCAKSPKRLRGMFPEELHVAADVRGVVLPSQVEPAAKTTAGKCW